MSTSVLTATGAACELRYLRLGGGRAVVLLHPLLMQLEYFQPLIKLLDTEANLRVHRGRTAEAPVSMRPPFLSGQTSQVAKLIEGVLR